MRTILLATVFGMALQGRMLYAWHSDSFETPDTIWKPESSDCRAQALDHRRVLDTAHSGAACEYLRIAAGNGTFVRYDYPLEAARLIEELRPSVWINADRPGLQLMAWVVLPRTRDPATGEPVGVWVRGTSYENAGKWQQLVIDTQTTFQQQVSILRNSQPGLKIDEREAYLARLVLNVYGGPGLCNVWIDDLEIEGYHVVAPWASSSAAAVGTFQDRAAGADRAWGSPGQTAGLERRALDGSVFVADGRPFVPAVIEYNGEPFEWLQQLGFNTIWLPQPPTDEQLRIAQRLGVWLVAPPPSSLGEGPLPAGMERLLAWDLGGPLGLPHVELTRQRVELVRELDSQRPLVGHVAAGLWEYSATLDVLVLDRPTIGTGFESSAAIDWLRQRQRLARVGRLFWGTVDTQPARSVVEQLVALRAVGGPKFESARLPEGVPTHDADQIRLAAHTALAAGVRGLWFKSYSRLDSTDPATRRRALALRLINSELALIEPWIAAGRVVDDVPTTAPDTRVVITQAERARMATILHAPPRQQFVVGLFQAESVPFDVLGIPITDRIYQITGAGPRELRRRPGLRVVVENPDPVSWVVMTDSERPWSHIAHQLASRGREMANLRFEMTREALSQTQEVEGWFRTPGASGARSGTGLDSAVAELQHARRMLDAGDLDAAHRRLQTVQRQVARTRRDRWEQAIAGFPSPVASPCCTSYATLPLHEALRERVRTAMWGYNVLAAGDFENLPQMQQAGWQQELADAPQIQATAELSLHDPRAGRSSLRLQAQPDPGSSPAVVEFAPIRIDSAPVDVRAGQLVRIHGWVKVPQPLTGSVDGLLIYDNQAGLALAHRELHAPGWRQFDLYRAVTAPGPLIVSFELTGLGEAWLDDVTIAVIELASQ